MASVNDGSIQSPAEVNAVPEKLTSNPDGPAATPVTPPSSYPSSIVACIRDPPCRFIFTFMGFFCFFNLYALRVNLSVAVVQMVNVTYMKQLEAESANETKNIDSVICAADNKTASASSDGPFNWDSKHKGYILASFFWGYIFTQLPGGLLAQRFGGKLVLLVGIAWSAIWTILTPVIAKAWGFAGLLAIRILEGFGQGVAFPAMHVMLSNWAPPLERGRMATFVYAGSHIGAVVTMGVSGVLCHRLNWESVFYVSGAIGILWSVMWIFLVYDKPSLHPRITSQERTYIETAQGPQRAKGVELKTPWLKIATSLPVYGLMMANFSHTWGNFFLLTVTPQFLSYILKFNIESSGVVAGSPYLTMWFGTVLGGLLTDFLISRHLMSVTWVRKLFVFLGYVTVIVSIIGLGYVNCEKELAIFILLIVGFGVGLSWVGWVVNHLDIAPPLAGTLFGITNTISTIPGFAAPAIVGAVTYRNQTHAAWRIAFYITAAVHLFGFLGFVIFGTAKRQKWSYPELPPEDADAPVPLKSTKIDKELGEVTQNGATNSTL